MNEEGKKNVQQNERNRHRERQTGGIKRNGIEGERKQSEREEM